MKKRPVLQHLHLSLVGAGTMGQSIISGLLSCQQLGASNMTASDENHERLQEIHEKFHIHTTLDNRTAVRKGQVIVLAVKPQVLPTVLAELAGKIKRDALVLSIVAGATIESIATGLRHRAIVRTMPNTPSQIGEGMTVWTATSEVSTSQREQALAIIESLGHQLYVGDERFLNMATAVSGSGPAYVFLLMEALIDAAVHLGFSRPEARRLVVQTIRGSAHFAERSSMHLAEMRDMVTSPGGTTAAALYELEKGSFRTVMASAVQAAYERSVTLGQVDTKPMNTQTAVSKARRKIKK